MKMDFVRIKFSAMMADSSHLESSASELCDELIDVMILEEVFKIHHDMKSGILDVLDGETEDTLVTENSYLEVVGQQFVMKKVPHCFCPNCKRTLSASRFAPHLERCMGMGRYSSRIASQRIANNIKENVNGSSSEEDVDEEWLTLSDKAKSSKASSETEKSVKRRPKK